MKTRTKALLLSLCAMMLVAASIFGTMAYLTSTDEVKNTFTVGNVAITLDEAKVNAYGQELCKDGTVYTGAQGQTKADRVKANSYKLLPGHTYIKDPMIHVADGSEDCYIFITVDNGIASVEHTIADQLDTPNSEQNALTWVQVKGYTNLYCYSTKNLNGTTDPRTVHAQSNPRVFNTITIDGTATNEQLDALKNSQIVINAYAVQVDGFEGMSAKQIWETAFDGQTTTAKPTTAPAT